MLALHAACVMMPTHACRRAWSAQNPPPARGAPRRVYCLLSTGLHRHPHAPLDPLHVKFPSLAWIPSFVFVSAPFPSLGLCLPLRPRPTSLPKSTTSCALVVSLPHSPRLLPLRLVSPRHDDPACFKSEAAPFVFAATFQLCSHQPGAGPFSIQLRPGHFAPRHRHPPATPASTPVHRVHSIRFDPICVASHPILPLDPARTQLRY